jgi:aquaglyceroporin related protein, other eukaryote
MAVWRGFPWRKVPVYWLAQFLGALTGAAIVFADYRKAISSFAGEGVYTVTGTNATAGLFSTYPAAFMTPEGSFFSEVLGTCILLLVILGQADDHNMHAAKNSPLVVAFTVAGIGISLGWETGYASKFFLQFFFLYLATRTFDLKKSSALLQSILPEILVLAVLQLWVSTNLI